MTNEVELAEDNKVREEKSNEGDSGKSIKDQKDDWQSLQSDIRNIKEGLQEIKDTLERTKVFSVLSTLGSVLIAIGILGMGAGFSLVSSGSYYAGQILILAGAFFVGSGLLMISSAEPYVGSVKLENLLFKNIRLWLAIIFLLIAILIIAFANLRIAI
jgi:hypothetical protein